MQRLFTKEPSKKIGYIIPLFERLCDDETHLSHDNTPKKNHILEDAIRSVELEVYRILSSRSFNGEYGLKDFESIDMTNKLCYEKIASMIKNSLLKFEPRLKNLSVEVSGYKSQSLFIRISGNAVLGEYITNVFFNLNL